MRRAFALALPLALAMACGSSSSSHSAGDAGGKDASPETASTDSPQTPELTHLVVIVQENHTFDSYFGRWCTANTGSNPTCTSGPSCCEAGPGIDPGSNTTPSVLTDAFNAARDPSHLQACELMEIDGGKMDGYVTAQAGCGSALNFAYADSTAQPYWTMAQQGALADHYFQPIAGQSSSNDMYLARAQFVFVDNDVEPQAIGSSCSSNVGVPVSQYTDPTVADLLDQGGVTWAWYSEGYETMQTAVASGSCPSSSQIPADCVSPVGPYDCAYDPDDNPFSYYKGLVDNSKYFKDYSTFATDLSGGTLPQVSYIKALLYKTEHPGYGNTVTAGATFVTAALAAIQASSYASSTLILVTWDEGGGLFDHISPPPNSPVDHQPYGTRIPLIAVGPFARTGTISHVPMEHSSIVKFIEQHWFGQTGQLNGRDGAVANIGSLLDPSLGVPEN